jgi:hypothetical protein
MRPSRAPLAIALALAGVIAAPAARCAALYVNRTAVVEKGEVRLRDLVRATGEVSAAAREILESAVATVSGALLVVPARLYSGLLERAFGADSILVGSRTLVVPRGLLADDGVRLFGDLADFLWQQGVLGEERAELEVAQTLDAGLPAGAPAGAPAGVPAGTAPFFKLTRSVAASGAREVTCSVSLSASEPPVGTVRVRVRTAAATTPGVRASDRVQVLFRKGPITVEMEGKSLASAGFGESVSVRVPESLRSFSGRVIGNKAVEVELP